MFVKETLPIHKVVRLVVYRPTHGYSANFMIDMFHVCTSMVQRYMDFIIDVLSDEQKLCAWYISIPQQGRLQELIDCFQFTCSLWNVVGYTDIPLAEKPSTCDTIVHANFYCARKGFNFVVHQFVCNVYNLLWNVCCNTPEGTIDKGPFQSSCIYDQLQAREILKEHVVRAQWP